MTIFKGQTHANIQANIQIRLCIVLILLLDNESRLGNSRLQETNTVKQEISLPSSFPYNRKLNILCRGQWH